MFSEQAYKELKPTHCLVCNKTFDAKNIIPLNSTDKQELSLLSERMVLVKNEEARRKTNKKLLKTTQEDGHVLKPEKRKRRHEDSEGKRQHGIVPSDINVFLPKLEMAGNVKDVQSDAIKSLYKKRTTGVITNNFFSGTFNRYN